MINIKVIHFANKKTGEHTHEEYFRDAEGTIYMRYRCHYPVGNNCGDLRWSGVVSAVPEGVEKVKEKEVELYIASDGIKAYD